MLPYFKKSERFTRPSDRHNTSGQFDPTVHGFAGLLSVSLPGTATGIDHLFSAAIDELGGDFAFTTDTNTGNPLGFGEHTCGYAIEPFLILAHLGWSQAVIDGPTASRSSSSTGYLASEFLSRPNLHVLLNTQVSRIFGGTYHNSSKQPPDIRSVEYRLNKKGMILPCTFRLQ